MRRRILVPMAVAILTAVCFLPTLSGSFLNWDDNANFLDDVDHRGLGSKQVRWAFTSVAFGHYIPLTRLTWSMSYALGGMDPWGYHAVNVLLHALNALLFYFVAHRLLGAAVTGGDQHASGAQLDFSAAAAIAAVVFGIHPLRVESVAWISARPDLLSATFALLAVLGYLRAVDRRGPARRGPMLTCALTFAAAVLSKGAVLPLPVTLVLLDVYPLRRLRQVGWRPLLKEKIPLMVVMIAGAAVVVQAVREGSVLTISEHGVLARASLGAHAVVTSLTRFIWPASLSPLYEMPLEVSPLEPRFALALSAAILITLFLVRLRAWWPAGLTVWTFSALMLSPVSIALRMGADLAPDRYTYLSGLGFGTLSGAAALTMIRLRRDGAIRRSTAWAAALTGLVAIAGLGVTSWNFCRVWTSSETLWRWAVELDPACSICHGKLAESALGAPGGASRAAEAEVSLRRAIALRPDLPDAYFNLGAALIIQGRHAEAEVPFRSYMERVPIRVLRNALAREPASTGLRHHLVQALSWRARELGAQGRSGEAAALLSEARALESGQPTQP